nr:TRAP transporter substrate-binding protein DctP [uncultured Celeribacter sp.]
MHKFISRALTTSLFLGVSVSANATELTYNSFLPAGEPVNSMGIVPFWERIEEDTDGAYSGRMFYAGQMFGPGEILSGIKDGAIDAGHVQATATVNDMPYAAAVAEMQVYGTDPVVAAAAMAETYLLNCPQCTEEQAHNGIVTLAGTVTPSLYMVCAKEVDSVEDMKGLRLMTVLRSEQAVARHFEMTPVSLSFNEMLPSLQRGAIDCIFTMDSWFPAFQLQDMVKTVISTRSFGAVPIPNFLTLSREAWGDMDAATQRVFIDNAIQMTASLAVAQRDGAASARAYAIEHGVMEADLGEGFVTTFDAYVADEKADIERSFAEFGLNDLGPLIDAYRTSLAKWEAKLPDGVDAETLAEMIKVEIYDKIEF